jgi:ATP phosphoribosyltransferase regulatory subunit
MLSLELRLDSLHKSEQAAYTLRSLYEQYGYGLYRMAKFEEYDFYTEHKDFLPSNQILAFTDLSGKLMALKPDVTMSIVKRTRATMERPERLYYNESIYRPSRDAREFREIRQVGLEYIGRVTPHTDAELVTLALKSLSCVDSEFVLDVSHMGFLSGLLDSIGAPRDARRDIARCVEAKNAHELARIAELHGIAAGHADSLLSLVSLDGGAGVEESLAKARKLVANDAMQSALDELWALYGVFRSDGALRKALRLEFSIALDSKYYNGLVFRGYIKSAPRAILSGGRYDLLLRSLGVQGLEAIGFALYLDEVESLLGQRRHKGYDAVVLHDEREDPAALHAAVERIVAEGGRVYAGASLPAGGRGGARVYRLSGGALAELTPVELAAAERVAAELVASEFAAAELSAAELPAAALPTAGAAAGAAARKARRGS